MAAKIKGKIAKNIYGVIHDKAYDGTFQEFLGCLKLLSHDDKISWMLSFPKKPETSLNVELFKNSQKELIESETIKDIKYSDLYYKNEAELELNLKPFIKDVLDSSPTELSFNNSPGKVIVEFASPNIAKPFHVGHLRSTVIGNCISNVKKKLGKDVVKLNYLGDWGLQFGLVQVGMKLENYTDEEIKKNPLEFMYKAYVRGNREAAKDENILSKANKMFADLECGKEDSIILWQKYKDWTMEEFKKSFERVGVSFDHYNWESDYKRKEADEVLSMMEEKEMLSVDEHGRKVVHVGDSQIPLLKSNNTTLYLLRDLMAVIDRKTKHNFDEMYYVVENGQNLHFTSLFEICNKLDLTQGKKMEHVKFGRIHGMSSRKGNAVLLKDILDEAQERCYEKQKESKNTRTSLSTKDVADILGVSSVIVNDLKQNRKKDYQFDWSRCLQIKGNTGAHLQYCHCRLFSLEANCGAKPATDCDPDALLEPEAVNLILEIAKYELALWRSDYKLEPCVLVEYLFQLVKATNLAFKKLNVQHTEEHVGSQRLLMFNKSREVLAEGLKLLGLKLLTQI